MAGSRTPGPLGGAAAFMEIDEGTLCRSTSPPPGSLQGGDAGAAHNVLEEVAQLAKKAAAGLGERMIKPEKSSGVNADVASQEHRHKTEYRAGSGREVQSAHLVNSSSVSDLPGYVRDRALTVLLSANQHKAFDDYWKAWAHDRLAKAKPGEDVKVTVSEWEKVLNDALDSVPELRGRTADTMSFMIRTELYQALGLEPDQLIRLPYS